ncbi:MAG: AraC family transcriptional regulator [Bacteroidota bacterium]
MEVLNQGEYRGEIVFRRQFEDAIITHTHYAPSPQKGDWHYHENLHICLVFQKGRSETSKQTRYTQKGGSLFFYHAQERHRWTAAEPFAKSANIELGEDFLQANDLSEANIQTALSQRIDAKSLFLKIQKEMLANDRESQLALQALLLELVSFPVPERSSLPPAWVNKLSALLAEQWQEELSLPQIASILGVHPVTISKYFRKYFDCTLGTYRRKLKIEKSIALIKQGGQSLSEIAHYCNFADQSHFTRNFKAQTGFLPKDFRHF